MNLIDNAGVLERKDDLSKIFRNFADNVLPLYEGCQEKVVEWEYSLGIIKDIIPNERLVPSVNDKAGKLLKKVTDANRLSKQLVSTGFNSHGQLIIMKKKYDKDIEKYGENIRFIHASDDGNFLLNARIYAARPENNKLMSVCHIYQEDNFIFYLSVTPPRDWSVRVDEIADGKIKRSSMFATSWVKQIDYDYIYNADGELSRVMIGDVVHWENS